MKHFACDFISFIWHGFLRKIMIGLGICFILLLICAGANRLLLSYWSFTYTDFDDDPFGKSAQSYLESIKPFPDGTEFSLLRHESYRHGDYYHFAISIPSRSDYQKYMDTLKVDETYQFVETNGIIFYKKVIDDKDCPGCIIICADKECCNIDIFYKDSKPIDRWHNLESLPIERVVDYLYDFEFFTHTHD